MRDVLIIGIACAAAILLGAWLYFSGSGTGQMPIQSGTAFTVLDKGIYSGSITERKNYRIKNQEELADLWKLVNGTGAPTNVNFDTSEVIAVFDGTHATGGYAIEVTSITDTPGGARAVAIQHTSPGETCVTTDAISSPYEIVVLAKSTSPLTHTDEESVNECH